MICGSSPRHMPPRNARLICVTMGNDLLMLDFRPRQLELVKRGLVGSGIGIRQMKVGVNTQQRYV